MKEALMNNSNAKQNYYKGTQIHLCGISNAVKEKQRELKEIMNAKKNIHTTM